MQWSVAVRESRYGMWREREMHMRGKGKCGEKYENKNHKKRRRRVMKKGEIRFIRKRD
ncbi:hypothetical protein C8R44DRAFT_772064 [Mycena epipterygia]|nr:hypothetical protein C8R44DRAFT_772064 [Mycena epipterygia]